MKIGNLDMGHRAILAPMAEVTDAPFRQICREQGAGLTFTQMVSAKGVIENSFSTLRVLAFGRQEKPIGVQFLGNDPEYLGKAIQEIKSLRPDLIDLNCGCSVTQVCKFGLGSAILDDSALLGRLVKRMVQAANGEIPISVKIRIGRSREKINVVENARIIEDNGASMITVHGRARSDSYKDDPLWKWIGEVKKAVKIPVVGNGSLFEPEDCLRMLNETGCDSLFIARGALGNPFLFRRLNSVLETGTDPGAPEIEEVAAVALRHLNLIVKDSGTDAAIKKARKHLVWYFRFYNGLQTFIKQVYAIDSLALLTDFIDEHAHKIRRNEYPREDFDAINRSFNERVLFWMNEGAKEAINQ